ncbi:hypothetical protein JCGZ_18130 [Jatropha curcas]|uniref:Aminotransferase-like plant mobile domain-containing protein n=1 Tax=Jatropha curcas TaxID=180498 RepID=A0A067KD21_JATCU|nr:hypothetical protein JCGZ_18130 [Jatropha curcas]
MDVDPIARTYLFYLLSTTLFTNHGNVADLALLLQLQDLDATSQFNWGAATLSYLYYGMDLCIRGAHLKIGYKRSIKRDIHGEMQLTSSILFKQSSAISIDVSSFSDSSMICTTLERGYMSGSLARTGERSHTMSLTTCVDEVYPVGAGHCCCSEGVNYYKSPRAFVPGAYAVFARTQLLIHVPPPTEFNPFVEVKELDRGQVAVPEQQQQHGKRVRRGSKPIAPDTAAIVGMPEHGPGTLFSFILDHTGQLAQGMLKTHLVSPYRMLQPGCTHRVDMVPTASRARGVRCGGHTGSGAERQFGRDGLKHVLSWVPHLISA